MSIYPGEGVPLFIRCHPFLVSFKAESCDCNTSLRLTRDELRIYGGGRRVGEGAMGGSDGALGREAEEESLLLKKACQNNENK